MMENDIYLKVIVALVTMVGGLVLIIYKSIINSIEKIEDKNNDNFNKLENKFDTKFKELEAEVRENNNNIKDIISRQDSEIQLINKKIALLDSEIKYLSRRVNKIDGLDSNHY